MSVVSSRVNSISSILKTPGVRTKFTGQQKKIGFKLPTDLKDLLLNFENGKDRQRYQDLICILRDSPVKDNDFLEFLTEVRNCTNLLNPIHKLFIEVILNIEWRNRTSDIISLYKEFVIDLMCEHIYHSKFIIDKLVNKFKPANKDEKEWPQGKCPEEDLAKFNHVHDIFRKLLKLIPMCKFELLQCLTNAYPHLSMGAHTNETYLFSLIQIMEYAPEIRRDILCLIINKLVILDVNAPPDDIQYYEDEEMDEENDTIIETNNTVNNESGKMKHPIAHTLDVCMEQMFSYVYDLCHINGEFNMESFKGIFYDLLHAFEKIILVTHASHHVQFIMFYICSFKVSIANTFVRWLWQKVSNPNIAPVLRQNAVSYISSLLARSKYIQISLLQEVISEMSNWIHSYIQSQDSLDSTKGDIRVHTVFYSICEAMFYLIAFRHKDLMDGKKNLLFLQGLNLTKIVTCKLNPLKVCQPAVVQNFAAVTRNYQLAYCYTIIERNSRTHLPVMQNSNCFEIVLETFFPFDPYYLLRSGYRINDLYNKNYVSVSSEPVNISSTDNTHENDEDDFMDESFSMDSETQETLDKFSYGSSPGFLYT